MITREPLEVTRLQPTGTIGANALGDPRVFRSLRRTDTLRELGPKLPHVTGCRRGGHYLLERSFELDERDVDVTFVAARGEAPIAGGGRLVTARRAGTGWPTRRLAGSRVT